MFKLVFDGKEVKLYDSFTISKNISNFVDTFNVSLANPAGLYSKNIPIGASFKLYLNDVLVFKGICETKNVGYGEVGSRLTISGREELMLLTEDDISPLKKKYENVSDNFIIEDVCQGYGWKFDLVEPTNIKEYDIPNNGVRKGQVVNDVVSRNNFYVYKIGDTIYKRAEPAESDYTERKKLQFTLATQGGGFVDYNNRLLDVSISEDITGVKSILKGFTYGDTNTKPKIEKEIKNDHLLAGTYPQILRNIDSGQRVAPVINRQVNTSVPVKSVKELNSTMKKMRREQDIQISVTIKIAEFLDLHILDTSEIFIQDEDIKQYMYIKSISYNYDSSNKFYTQFVYTPIIRHEHE